MSQKQDIDLTSKRLFSHRFAHIITRFRWLIIVAWTLATIASITWLPNLDTVVAHTKTNYLPSSSPLITGQNLLSQVDPTHTSISSAVVAIHNAHGLTNQDKFYFSATLHSIEKHRHQLGITSISDLYNTNKKLTSTFLSKDRTTEIALVGFPQSDISDATKVAMKNVQQAFSKVPSDAHIYLTGDAPIQQDDISISQQGVQKTIGVTIALVLIILLLVFRSLLAPVMTLLAIGLSYVITSGLVAAFAQKGLPISNFTQTFLIAILFGAGTDYSVIMINRFREELTKDHGNKEIALRDTLHAVSKTVFYSSFTVIVSFAILFFAQFGLYRTAVGVSFGVAVVLLNGMTLLPALMSVLGPSMYWPRKPKPGMAHRPSFFWSKTSMIATSRPWLTLLALVIILVPIALLFTNQRTFDPLNDIPMAPSAQGFRVVSAAFGKGNVLPSQFVLQTKANLRSSKGLTTIENISNTLANLPSIAQVESATRPTGSIISSFELASQNQSAASGLQQVESGLAEIQNRLSPSGQQGSPQNSPNQLLTASGQITNGIVNVGKGLHALSLGTTKLSLGTTQATKGSQQLTQNMNKLASSLVQTKNAAQQINQGMSQSATGTTKLAEGAKQLQGATSQLAQGVQTLQSNLAIFAKSLQQTKAGASQLSAGVSKSATGSSQLQQASSQLTAASASLHQGTTALVNALAAWAKAHPGTSSSPSWAQITALAANLQSGTSSVQSALQALQTGSAQLTTGLQQLQDGASKLTFAVTNEANGATQLTIGTSKLQAGFNQQAQGIQSLYAGTVQLAKGNSSLSSGTNQLTQAMKQQASGALQLAQGSAKLSSGLSGLTSGVSSVATGAQKLSSGTQTLAAGSKLVTGGVAKLTSVTSKVGSGLTQATQGVAKLHHGVSQVTTFLRSTQKAQSDGNPGFYVPSSAIHSNSQLKQAMNAFISPDGHVAKFTITLRVNPYSMTAINAVASMQQAANIALANSPIHTGTLYATGTTPTQYELNKISNQDFTRTVTLVLAAIFILLVAMLRSIITPLYIIGSLAGTYFASMGLLQTITDHVLHKPGLSWPVPFFVFLLLVALGVDYSIFLMSRFEEEMQRGHNPKQAISVAMGKMGNVIFSAAVIMAGTFGSMMVAGVASLVEIGMSVVIGLFLYFTLFLGFFIPAMATIVEHGHSWPFHRA